MGKFELPKVLIEEEDTKTSTYTRFTVEPFERGYGFTLGNALRRVLYSSLEGAAITDVKIEGALHEFSTLDGVYEDVTEIILNLKRVVLKMDGRESRVIRLEAKGEKEVTAGDLETGGTVEVVNPDQPIARLAKGGKLNMELGVGIGRGFRPSEMNKSPESPIGVIPIDSIFSPVKKVKYSVEDTRVGQRTDFNRLILEIWTDGRLNPREALIQSSAILKRHLDLFTDDELYAIEFEEEVEKEDGEDKLQKLLSMPINEIELSVRSANCIKAADIQTIGDLVRRTEAEMLKYRNFGKKSLDEIKSILSGLGLALGMELPEPDLFRQLSGGSNLPTE
ncbi:MAG: DNA-directed RNA polymerase subunit alpha [Candidatus Erginobacter occultus]|nr:DNA-directed RNA polymerase subunit alpha [Candidatus Erginobacter occultus]